MKRVIAAALLLVPLCSLAGDAPLITRLNRVALAINDQASYGSYGSTFEAMITRSIPVVLDMTVQTQSTPAGVVTLVQVWSDLRANRPLSEKLYAAAQDYSIKKALTNRTAAALAGGPATLADAPEVSAAVTRAGISFPVKFIAAEMGPIERPGVSKAKNYSAWERAVLEELRKSNAADTLMVTNVLLWGIRMGGTKCEQQTGGAAAWRALSTSNLASTQSDACARAMLSINNRLVNVGDGKTIAEFNSNYVIEGGSTEGYIADSAAMFEAHTNCLVDWYGENLKRTLNGTATLKDWECKPPAKAEPVPAPAPAPAATPAPAQPK